MGWRWNMPMILPNTLPKKITSNDFVTTRLLTVFLAASLQNPNP